MEARGLVGAADAEVEAHGLADLGLHRLVGGETADLAVEDVVARPLIDEGLVVLGQLALGAARLHGVELALQHVPTTVARRQAIIRLDADPTVPTVSE